MPKLLLYSKLVYPSGIRGALKLELRVRTFAARSYILLIIRVLFVSNSVTESKVSNFNLRNYGKHTGKHYGNQNMVSGICG